MEDAQPVLNGTFYYNGYIDAFLHNRNTTYMDASQPGYNTEHMDSSQPRNSQIQPTQTTPGLPEILSTQANLSLYINLPASIYLLNIRGCIKKFPDWSPGARSANGTVLCHYV
jgi:hypothetical protein